MNREFGNLALSRIKIQKNQNNAGKTPGVIGNSRFQPSAAVKQASAPQTRSGFQGNTASSPREHYGRLAPNAPSGANPAPNGTAGGTPTRIHQRGGTSILNPAAVSQPPSATNPFGTSPYGLPNTGPVGVDGYNDVLNKNPGVTKQIKDAYEQRYGPVSNQQLVGLVNKVVNEGYPIDVALNMVQQGYNIPEIIQQAADLVDLEMGTAKTEIERLIEEILRQRDLDIKAQEVYGSEMDKRMAEIGQVLANQLGNISSTQQGRIDDIMAQTQGLYSGNVEKLAGLNSALTNSLGDYAAGLGLSEAMPDANTEQQQFLEFAQAMGLLEGTSQAQKFGGLASIEAALRMSDQSIGAKDNARERAIMAQLVQGSINDIYNNTQGELNEQYGQLSDMAKLRGSNLRQTVEQLEQLKLDRQRQSEIDALDRLIAENTISIQNGQLRIQQGELDLAIRQQQIDQALATEDLNIRRQQLGLQLEELRIMERLANNDLQRQLIGAQIAQIQAGIRQTDRELDIAQSTLDQQRQENANGSDALKEIVGVPGIRSLQTWAESRGFTSRTTSVIQSIINSARNQLTQELSAPITDANGNVIATPPAYPDDDAVYNKARQIISAMNPNALAENPFIPDEAKPAIANPDRTTKNDYLEGLDVYFGRY